MYRTAQPFYQDRPYLIAIAYNRVVDYKYSSAKFYVIELEESVVIIHFKGD